MKRALLTLAFVVTAVAALAIFALALVAPMNSSVVMAADSQHYVVRRQSH